VIALAINRTIQLSTKWRNFYCPWNYWRDESKRVLQWSR